MAEQSINVYLIDIDTKEMVDQRVYTADVSQDETTGLNVYSIDYEQYMIDNKVYGIFALHNGDVHSSYEYQNGAYITTYEADNVVYFGDEVMDSWILYVSAESPSSSLTRKSAELIDDYVEARIKFGDSSYSTESVVEADDENEVQFISITISEGLMSDSFLSFGSNYSPNCSVVMTKCDYAVPGVWFRVEYKIDGVWQCFGVFKINSVPTRTSDEVSFSGVGILESVFQSINYGRIAGSLNSMQRYTYEETGIPVIIDFIEKLKEKTRYWENLYMPALHSSIDKITNESDVVTKITYESSFSLGNNYRDIWSNIAVFLQANVVERNGVIHVVHLDTAELAESKHLFLFDGNQYMSEPSDAGVYYYMSPVVVQSSLPSEIETLIPYSGALKRVGAYAYTGTTKATTIIDRKINSNSQTIVKYPVTIDSENLFYYISNEPQYWGGASQYTYGYRQMIDSIERYSEPFVYKPYNIELMGYHPCIFPGNIVAVDNGNTVDYEALVGNVTITYDGVLSMMIDTPCDVQIDGVNGSNSGGSGASSTTGIASFTSFVIGVQNASVINDKAITGSKIADSTITATQIADSTITGSKIASSTIEDSNIKNGTITGSKIALATIENSNIKDGTIEGAKIDFSTFANGVISGTAIDTSTFTDGQISGSVIDTSTFADGSISGSKITDSTITNTQIADSTITGSKIVDGTLDGSTKIEDATITYAKMASSFISDLTANTAYINNLKSNVADINTLTASDAIIRNIFSNSIISNSAILGTLQSNIIDADYIRAVVIDVGALTADEADIRYANIALSNIDVADIGRFYAGSGILTDVLIQDGSVTGLLNGVRINADVITTGTLAVDRLLVTGEDSIVYQINVDSSGLSEQELSDEKYQKYLNGTDIVANSITATQIAASTITANELNIANVFGNQAVIDEIFAQNVMATGTITGATLNGVTVTSESGKIGGWTITSTSLYAQQGEYADRTVAYRRLGLYANADAGVINFQGAYRKANSTASGNDYQMLFEIDGLQYVQYANSEQSYSASSITPSYIRVNQTGIRDNYIYAYKTISLTNGIVAELSQYEGGLFRNGAVFSNSVITEPRVNDQSWIRAIGNGTYGKEFEIATGDNNSNGTTILVRQYDTSNVVQKEIKLLDENGDSEFPGTVNADTFEAQTVNADHMIVSENGYIDCGKWRIHSENSYYNQITSGNTTLNPEGLIFVTNDSSGMRATVQPYGLEFSNSITSIGYKGLFYGTRSSGNVTGTGLVIGDLTTTGDDVTTLLASKLQIGTNPIYANNGTAYGMQWGTKNDIVGATSSTTANRTGLIIGQVGSAASAYGALVFGASSYIYAKGSLVLNASGSVASNDNRAVNGGTVYNYLDNFLNGSGESKYLNYNGSYPSSISVPNNSNTSLCNITLSPGMYIIQCIGRFNANTTGQRTIALSTSPTGSAIDRFTAATVSAASYGTTYALPQFTKILHVTANTTYYLVAWQNSGSALPCFGGIQYIKIGNA